MAGMVPKGDNNPMAEFMSMMRLSDLLKMAGGALPTQAKIALNEALTKIKKES